MASIAMPATTRFAACEISLPYCTEPLNENCSTEPAKSDGPALYRNAVKSVSPGLVSAATYPGLQTKGKPRRIRPRVSSENLAGKTSFVCVCDVIEWRRIRPSTVICSTAREQGLVAAD